jgi:hypothetical protein
MMNNSSTKQNKKKKSKNGNMETQHIPLETQKSCNNDTRTLRNEKEWDADSGDERQSQIEENLNHDRRYGVDLFDPTLIIYTVDRIILLYTGEL